MFVLIKINLCPKTVGYCLDIIRIIFFVHISLLVFYSPFGSLYQNSVWGVFFKSTGSELGGEEFEF